MLSFDIEASESYITSNEDNKLTIKHLDNSVSAYQSEKLNPYYLELFCPNFEGIIVSTFNLC